MYSVSDEFKALSTAAARMHDIYIILSRLVNGRYEEYAVYTEWEEDNPIISFKIINGQTTGGFSIGGTYCATLEITAHINAPFQINDQIIVQTAFKTLNGASTSQSLFQGVFYVDTITDNQYSMRITALDVMMRLAKDYNSALSYPATVKSMLNEISSKSGVGISSVDIFNNASVATKPVKAKDDKGNEAYFTRREVLGYLAGLNGGNAYINNVGQIAFSTPRETNYTISWENVISQTLGGAELTISSVVLNTTGTSSSTDEDWDANAVQLYVPLDVGEDVAAKTEQQISGTHFESITLKKQGTGMFEPGDLVNYKALDGSTHKMLIMGVVYELTNGFFYETLYSLAQSSTQRQYSGAQNISQNIVPTGMVSGGSGSRVTSYEYLSDTSAKLNGIIYTVEKNESGLITEINDSAGNSLKPVISGEITDVTLHNAVFMAVAMHGGFGSPTIMPIRTGLVGYFDYKFNCTPTLWASRIGDNYIPITGGADLNAECLKMPNGTYGIFREMPYQGNGDFVLYAVVKSEYDNTVNRHDCIIGSSYGDVPGAWRTLSTDGYSTDYHFRCWFVDTFGGGIGGELSSGGAVKSYEKYSVVVLTQTSGRLRLYIDGEPSLDSPTVNVRYGDYWGLNCLANSSGGVRGYSNVATFFKMFAIGRIPHTAVQISENTEWLKEYYGI